MQAGGNCGSFMTASLLQTGKHTITAITRADSQSKLPEGVISKKVDYSKPETLVEALRGQDALVITLSGHVSKEAERLLINAAGEAGVRWILPNEWSPDTTNETLVKDVFIFQSKGEQSHLYTLYKPLADQTVVLAVVTRKAIADLGKSFYIAVPTGFWYEWSLAVPAAFGFDFANRTVTLFDEGETKISISTWPQVDLQSSTQYPDKPLTIARLVVLSPLFSVFPSRPRARTKKPALRTSRTKSSLSIPSPSARKTCWSLPFA